MGGELTTAHRAGADIAADDVSETRGFPILGQKPTPKANGSFWREADLGGFGSISQNATRRICF
jgi:hypothetical protein